MYTSNPNTKFVTPDVRVNKILPEDQIRLEQPITTEDFSDVLKGMSQGQCLGIDGLTVAFMKTFWIYLKVPCYEVMMQWLEERLLYLTARRGIIDLIPKQKKDSRRVTNLRLITLLCVSYKILETVLVNRIKSVIDQIISKDQKGFREGQSISVNICQIFDLVTIVKQEEREAVILSIDFKKCFDMIEFDAIFGALDCFGFGEKFVSTIQTTYTQFQACVQSNGYFSEYFPVPRSVHQCRPNSSFLFLICAELLANILRQEKDIQGFPVDEMMHLLSQFADDMDISLNADEDSLKKVFCILEKFKAISGFQVNYDKTTVYHIGSLRNSNARFYVEKKLYWTNDPINFVSQ